MAHRLQSAALVLVAAAATAVTTTAPAHAAADQHDHDPIIVIADGLDDPFGLAAENGRFYVAESGTGEISGIIPGGDGPSVRVAGFPAPAGVDRRQGTLFIVTGEASEPGATGGSTLWTSRRGEPRTALADLMAHELAENPDGQRQFGDDGAPLDALSNPFSVLAGRGGHEAYAYVADAGANAVLAVDAEGTVSTFFVPPVVTTGACEGAENSDPAVVGCDPVPTGLAWGPDGNLYVSTLGSEAPGAARVHVLDPHDGSVVEVLDGFTGAVGVAVGDDGSVYVSELFEGAPATPELPPGFDISTIGQIVRVAPDGTRSAAQVTLPLGLRFAGGALHSTAWSVVGSLGQTGAGQVVRVDAAAFSPLG